LYPTLDAAGAQVRHTAGAAAAELLPAAGPRAVTVPMFVQACGAGDVATAAAYLASGGDVNAVSPGGYTALHRACYKNRVDVVRLLLEQVWNRVAVRSEHSHCSLGGGR
jgi:hypothetical protein